MKEHLLATVYAVTSAFITPNKVPQQPPVRIPAGAILKRYKWTCVCALRGSSAAAAAVPRLRLPVILLH